MPQRPTFSARTAWDTSETDLARAIIERRERGLPLLDLTASNPTHCGFIYDEAAILSALARRESLVYDPDPRGMSRAREAVAKYYADHGASVDPEQLFLTTSTSEAYSFLFRLLCDPGDEVLIAQPSYPLFDFLAQIENVRLVPYPLFYDHGWRMDAEALESSWPRSLRRHGPSPWCIRTTPPGISRKISSAQNWKSFAPSMDWP